MRKQKAQAALEFLTTYGWAFLVILIMIGALAYFGVLSPDNFIPDKCIASTGFTCSQYGSFKDDTNGGIGIVLTNGPRAITLDNQSFTLSVTGSQCSPDANDDLQINRADAEDITDAADLFINANEAIYLYWNCSNIDTGERPNVQVTGKYRVPGQTIVQTFEVEMSARMTDSAVPATWRKP